MHIRLKVVWTENKKKLMFGSIIPPRNGDPGTQGLSRAYLQDVLDQIAALRISACLALGLLLLPPLVLRIRALASVPPASHGTGREQIGSDHQSQLTPTNQMSLYRFSLSLPISMRR